jgi:hypothetical protein
VGDGEEESLRAFQISDVGFQISGFGDLGFCEGEGKERRFSG